MPTGGNRSTRRVLAPAKLNLHLELVRRREDGYHDLDTVMVAIDLYDQVSLTPGISGPSTLSCRWLPNESAIRRKFGPQASSDSYQLPPVEGNLAWRAFQEYQRATGIQENIEIRIEKRIPMGAGLGGASADAAGVLVGLAQLYNAGVIDETTMAVAARVGSDVPFLVRAAAGQMSSCRAQGRGEQMERLDIRGDLCFVLLYPPFPVSTKRVYGRAKIPLALVSSDMITSMLTVGSGYSLFHATHNRLKAPACDLEPEIVRSLIRLRRAGAVHAEMTGSGSTCFAMVKSMSQALCMARRLQGEGVGFAVPARPIGLGFSKQPAA